MACTSVASGVAASAYSRGDQPMVTSPQWAEPRRRQPSLLMRGFEQGSTIKLNAMSFQEKHVRHHSLPSLGQSSGKLP